MTLSYSGSLKNARADAITTKIGASGLLRIYNGTPPATVDTALSGNTKLAELPCSATFAPAASGGVLTVNAITQANAVASGTASFFRYTDAAGNAHVQGTVGTSGADLNLNDVAIVTGGPVVVTSYTFTEGN